MIMQEKYLLSIGAGLILMSFGIVLTFGIAASVEDDISIENEITTNKNVKLTLLPRCRHFNIKD